MPPPAAHKHAITPAAAGSTDAPLAVVLQQAVEIGIAKYHRGILGSFQALPILLDCDACPEASARESGPMADQPATSDDDSKAPVRDLVHRPIPLWRTALKAIFDGGPGTCHFAITSVCNARCGFCNFAIDRLPKDRQHSVTLDEAKLALDILARNDIRYIHITGGEPLIHRDLDPIVAHARRLSMSSIIVTNGWLLTKRRLDRLVSAGVNSIVISIDAPSVDVHDDNRGLHGLSDRIRNVNDWCRSHKIPTPASVTMSRLVGNYAALPAFLRALGFEAVTFSYPLTALPSSYLSYRQSDLVTYTAEELDAAFEAVKALKRSFPVLNPTASLDDMQRHLRGEPERFGCLAGYKFFYLDWHLNLYRCHNWDRPMCHITGFDEVQRVRDGCTACMIDCYRDDSVMQHIAVAIADGVAAAAKGRFGQALSRWSDRRNVVSIKAVLEEAPLWRNRV
jgi:MoaA/NifB/PqqE/SkfB family radical SAM enzyme